MKLEYDVESKNPAYNGFWMVLQELDGTKYKGVSLWVKGDQKAGYTTVFKVELKNNKGQVGRYYATNITSGWQKITIPFRSFKGLKNFKGLSELVIVFEDRIATAKKGTIYIDDISFEE